MELDGCWQEGGGDLLVESCRRETRGERAGRSPRPPQPPAPPEPGSLSPPASAGGTSLGSWAISGDTMLHFEREWAGRVRSRGAVTRRRCLGVPGPPGAAGAHPAPLPPAGAAASARPAASSAGPGAGRGWCCTRRAGPPGRESSGRRRRSAAAQRSKNPSGSFAPRGWRRQPARPGPLPRPSPVPPRPALSLTIPPRSGLRSRESEPAGAQPPAPRSLRTCSRGSMVKDPAEGFMQATYWHL